MDYFPSTTLSRYTLAEKRSVVRESDCRIGFSINAQINKLKDKSHELKDKSHEILPVLVN